MPVIRTFVSYSSEDREAVLDALRRSAPYAVRPWLDELELPQQLGQSISAALKEAIRGGGCTSLSLFVTAASLGSAWVKREIALAREAGLRVLPVLLAGDPASVQRRLRRLLGVDDAIALRRDDMSFPQKWSRAVLAASGATSARDLVLHLGHREVNQGAVGVPEIWSGLPILDLRLDFPSGRRDLNPTDAEWAEIGAGLSHLRSFLRIDRLRVCGFAPLGVGAWIGHLWDRGTGTRCEVWNPKTSQAWSLELTDIATWESGQVARAPMQEQSGTYTPGRPIHIVFLRDDAQFKATQVWLQSQGCDGDLCIRCQVPQTIANPMLAAQVAREVASVFAQERELHPEVRTIQWICGLPLGLTVLSAWLLRAMGGVEIRFLDQVPDSPLTYRCAATWIA